MMKTSTTGTGRENLYVSRWFAWESMRFLEDPEEIRPTIDNCSAEENEERDVDDPNYPPSCNREGNVSAPESGEVQQDFSTAKENNNENVNASKVKQKRFKSPKKVAPKRRNVEDPRVQEAYNILKSKVRNEKKDESAMFGEYIAEKMRKLDSRQRALLQYRIHGLVLEAEMATSTWQTLQQQIDPPISSHLRSPSPFFRYSASLSSSSYTSFPLQSPLPLSSHTSPLPSPPPPSSQTSPILSPPPSTAHTTSPLYSQIASSSSNQLLTLNIPELPYDIRNYLSSFSNIDNM